MDTREAVAYAYLLFYMMDVATFSQQLWRSPSCYICRWVCSGKVTPRKPGGASPHCIIELFPDVHLTAQVPREHQEIVRLEGRYKSQGGLKEGMVVELANGESAMVVALKDDAVQMDANNMMAGKTRTFEVTLQHIEPAKR